MSQIEFTQKYISLQTMLLNFAKQLTQNEEDARDLLQETALKAFKYRQKYRNDTNLSAWLMTIMRNTFINNYRKQKRRQVLNDRTANNHLLNSGEATVRNKGEENATLSELEVVMEQVPAWAKVPLLMHIQGYQYDEIAEELDIPLGTVKSRIYYARKQIKAQHPHEA